MPSDESDRRPTDSPSVAFSFVRAALCPAHFTAGALKDRPEFAKMADPHHGDHAWSEALGSLSVGDHLIYPRQFPYRDRAGKRRVGTHLVTATFGLAPHDVDLLLAIGVHLRDLHAAGELPDDNRHYWTADFLGRLSGQSVSNPQDYLAIRSRLFRLAYTTYLNTLRWNAESETNEPQQFPFLNIEGGLSKITESKRPLEIRINPTFLDLVTSGHWISEEEFAVYQALGRNYTLKRWLLAALLPDNRRAASAVYLPDEFACHQLGMADSDGNVRLRRQRLKKRAAEARDADLIRPIRGEQGMLRTANTGALRGETILQWQAGPVVRSFNRSFQPSRDRDLAVDPLWSQVRAITDEHGRGVTAALYRHWLNQYGRALMQKHAPVVLAQMERRDPPLKKSAAAALVHYMQKDYEPPAWFLRERQQKRLARFDEVKPNQLSLEVLGMIVR